MKTKCPMCPSSDAFHIYNYGKADEYGHCFSCGYHQFPESIKRLESQVESLDKAAQKHISDVLSSPLNIELPFDSKNVIDVKALSWLGKYGIMEVEVRQNELSWSPSRHQLIFPIRDKDKKLVAFSARCFPKLGQVESDVKPKWFTRGPIQTTFHTVGIGVGKKKTIVLVEDPVSAIKVGRFQTAMPLFGATLSPKRLLFLHVNSDNVILWLDANKWSEAVKFAKSLEMVGIKTRVLYTYKDPKEHTNNEIFNLTTI